jgi:hypothetical protein
MLQGLNTSDHIEQIHVRNALPVKRNGVDLGVAVCAVKLRHGFAFCNVFLEISRIVANDYAIDLTHLISSGRVGNCFATFVCENLQFANMGWASEIEYSGSNLCG